MIPVLYVPVVRRGYALLVFGRFLLGADGLPSVKPTRRGAKRLLARSAIGESAWFRDLAGVVRVVVHPPDAVSGRPTYVVVKPRARVTASP